MIIKDKLSVTIITLNEEKNIGRCIDSLEGVADEIVVVDSFSTDQTEQICREKNVKFIQHPFEGHIQQKNFALQQASYDYVLSLDADETLSDSLKKSILAVKVNLEKDAYNFNRFTNYCGQWIKHCGWYPDRKLRLWNRHKGKWGGTNPHDKVIMNKPYSSQHLKGDLLHYSIYDVNQHIRQIHFFSDITAKDAYRKGKKGSLVSTVFSPPLRFIRLYFLKLGFLDGYYGFVICVISAYAKFLHCIKLREISRGKLF